MQNLMEVKFYTTGKVAYSIDDNILMNAEMLALSMYAKLNEERSDILSNLEESRTSYEE
ncbi:MULTISPECIES: hypothetical protein [Bacillaceae]|uniref:Cell division protein ZapA n=1 Tax=Metabacillus sediminis TaxID=3117746 RepID=A0ABZ2NIK8_9BACI|nr:hypothetical protein [Bacillus sp. SJS]